MLDITQKNKLAIKIKTNKEQERDKIKDKVTYRNWDRARPTGRDRLGNRKRDINKDKDRMTQRAEGDKKREAEEETETATDK